MCSFQYKLFTMDVHHTIVLIVLQFPVSWSLCNMYTLSMVDSVVLQKYCSETIILLQRSLKCINHV